MGEFIEANGIHSDVKVLTKIPALSGFSDCQQTIQLSVESSLNNMKCPIEVLFLHRAADSVLFLDNPYIFENLLNNYSISTLGVSVYEPKEIHKLAGNQFELAFQFPFNILDRRFETNNLKKGMRYARSVFLQGLLTSNLGLRQNAPKELLLLQNKYHKTLANYNLDPVQAALSFVVKSKKIDYFLIGVDSVSQLKNVLKTNLYTKLDILENLQITIDKMWLDPRNWS